MDDLPVLHVLAGDCRELPSGLFCRGKHVHSGCLHARPDQIHVPAFPPHALIYIPFTLFCNALLAVDTRISPEPEGLVEPIIEGRLLNEVNGSVHPEDQVLVEVVEVFREIIGAERLMARDAIKAEEQAGLVLGHHRPGLIGGRGIGGASQVLGISLAAIAALETDPVGYDDV